MEPQKETSQQTETKPKDNVDVDELSDSDTVSEVQEPHSANPLGEHAFLIIYALHTIQESLVAPVLPTIELKLKSPSERERKRSFRLLARLFSEPVCFITIAKISLVQNYILNQKYLTLGEKLACLHLHLKVSFVGK